MAERMVALKNMMNATVSVRKPEYGVNRKWNRRGQTMAIPYDTVEQLLWDDGFRRMIDSGILYIENLQDKKDLGLEPEDATEPENIIVLDEKKMDSLLKVVPITVFKREVSKLSKTQTDNLIDYAIENKIVDTAKCSYLKDLTQRDILFAISRREDIAREDAAAAVRKAPVDGRRI